MSVPSCTGKSIARGEVGVEAGAECSADGGAPRRAGVMIHKIDCCMLDLLAYHEKAAEEEREQGLMAPWAAAAAIMARAASFGERLPEGGGGLQPQARRLEHRLSLKSHPTKD